MLRRLTPLWGPMRPLIMVRQFSRTANRANDTVVPKITRRSFWSRKRVYWGAGIIAATVGAYNVNETFKTAVDVTALGTKRAATVSYVLFRCSWAYHSVLTAKYDSPEEQEAALRECHTRCAKITRWALETNAGLFIKIGQHIAALTYLFPEEWTSTMIPLQDKCPTTPYEDVERLILEDEGKPIEELFVSFDREPLGTASLAQVHRAELLDGTKVAVKVQHPSLKRFIPLDIMLIRSAIDAIEYFFPQYPLRWLSSEIENSIYTELDFREEARNAGFTSIYFEPFYDLTALRVPKVFWARRRLLCMEFCAGGRPDDLEFLEKHNISRSELSECFSHIFNNMIFTPGVGLHCDPHAGNIAIRPLEEHERHGPHNFEVILYDHGLYRYVPSKTRLAYAHLWLALLDSNEKDMRKYVEEFAGIGPDKFDIFIAAITGRDTENAKTNVMSRRTSTETTRMSEQIQQQGLLVQVMQMLREVPNIVLLILKTNDLTRYLDEKLDSPLGIVRTFLIMAQYCTTTIYKERIRSIASQYPSKWSLKRRVLELTSWLAYITRYSQLKLYSWVALFRPLT
ncbi:ABC1 family protein MCP2 [Wickerhamiella sorbophila]|uniref:ABC1 family protein MCP2 n=1 Tax=Wickerhamiella sorbophila TaxID=45607 RepID=A0A2T0FII1_9ASCO|nr:ABC1 family protein MCP2 [Wickerhamiella sorbophila]PRT54767.1 ABC1 family protein MCP2 [Wickerhamiella sorbophila]